MTGFHSFSSSICRHAEDISITVQLKQLSTASKHTLYKCTALPACGITDTHWVLSNGTHFSAWRIMAVVAADFICIAAQHQMIRWLRGSYTNSPMLLLDSTMTWEDFFRIEQQYQETYLKLFWALLFSMHAQLLTKNAQAYHTNLTFI